MIKYRMHRESFERVFDQLLANGSFHTASDDECDGGIVTQWSGTALMVPVPRDISKLVIGHRHVNVVSKNHTYMIHGCSSQVPVTAIGHQVIEGPYQLTLVYGAVWRLLLPAYSSTAARLAEV